MPPPEKEPARWTYRFSNFRDAYSRLRESCDEFSDRPFTDLEKEGLIARFSFTWELSWKSLKDYLESLGLTLETVAPRPVIRAAATARIISDAAIWLDALDSRNSIAHTYSRQLRDETVEKITTEYINIFGELEQTFMRFLDATGE